MHPCCIVYEDAQGGGQLILESSLKKLFLGQEISPLQQIKLSLLQCDPSYCHQRYREFLSDERLFQNLARTVREKCFLLSSQNTTLAMQPELTKGKAEDIQNHFLARFSWASLVDVLTIRNYLENVPEIEREALDQLTAWEHFPKKGFEFEDSSDPKTLLKLLWKQKNWNFLIEQLFVRLAAI